MIAFVALAIFMVVSMIAGFIVNLYLYSHKALPVTHFVVEPDGAAEPRLHLHDVIFV